MFNIIDCTKATGVTLRIPSAMLARLASQIATRLTGRMHDFERA